MTQINSSNFIARLDDLGQIAVSGADAANFLHNQLSNDVLHLTPDNARLAGYCNPKGRLLASFLLWRRVWEGEDTVFLQLPLELQPSIQKRLQMFVMRAKASLRSANEDLITYGLAGPAVAELFLHVPDAPYCVTHGEYGSLIRLPDQGKIARYQWITSIANADRLMPAMLERLQPVHAALWRLSEIMTGTPQIRLATQEKFVPQMINFELIGGVNFKKGCYPGQEIVARSQYLGKLKRRMLLASVASQQLSPGMEVFSKNDPEQPCGLIVNAETVSPEAMRCLVELKLAALDAGSIHCGAPDGPVLEFTELPYALIDPV